MIRVFLVETQSLARAALRKLFESSHDLRVIGDASHVDSALRCVRAHRVDVTVLAIRAPMSGLEWACRLLAAQPGGLVCVLESDARQLARHLLDRGVSGLVSETAPPDEAFDCIRRVHLGQVHLDPAIARRLALSPAVEPRPFDALSAREWQVLLMVTQGESAQSISRSLCLSPKTVSTYRSRILQKLGARSDLELLRLAISQGLLKLGDASAQFAPPP
ncbi:MAG: DNA-binding response regulator [Gammaproteobacteria bacterium]|nr:DNA-binding response regulator [Gammaproteobacteria bacterium]